MQNDNLVSPLRTIRQHCLDCSGTSNEVKLCSVEQCALWPYRLGHDPRRKKRVLNAMDRENLRARLMKKNLPVDTGLG